MIAHGSVQRLKLLMENGLGVLVDLNSASWNRLAVWLGSLDVLEHTA